MSERTAAFVARSGARSAVLRAVAAEGRPGEELVSTLDLSKSGVYKAINELAERDLIAQDGTAWTATALGRLVVDELDRHRRLDALLDHGEYWLTHDLSVLPDRFRRRLPELGAVDVMRKQRSEVPRTLLDRADAGVRAALGRQPDLPLGVR
jgi:predicted transcriptional regulator